MASEPEDTSTSKRVTPEGGTAPTKAAARKAAATQKSQKVDGKPPAAPSKPEARKIDNRKVAPKVDATRSGDPRKRAEVHESKRYTAPIPTSQKVSPWWVPVLMFGLLGVGMLIIFVNYLHWPWGDPSNIRLMIGLACILGGILAATRYQ